MWDLSSLTRDQTGVPGLARRILDHWTTGPPGKSREFPSVAVGRGLPIPRCSWAGALLKHRWCHVLSRELSVFNAICYFILIKALQAWCDGPQVLQSSLLRRKEASYPVCMWESKIQTHAFLFVCFVFLFVCFWPHCAACGILSPRPGIEPTPSAVKTQSPNHWTAREFPQTHVYWAVKHFSFYCSTHCTCLMPSFKKKK